MPDPIEDPPANPTPDPGPPPEPPQPAQPDGYDAAAVAEYIAAVGAYGERVRLYIEAVTMRPTNAAYAVGVRSRIRAPYDLGMAIGLAVMAGRELLPALAATADTDLAAAGVTREFAAEVLSPIAVSTETLAAWVPGDIAAALEE